MNKDELKDYILKLLVLQKESSHEGPFHVSALANNCKIDYAYANSLCQEMSDEKMIIYFQMQMMQFVR